MGVLNNLWNGFLDLVYPEVEGCLYCETEELVTDEIQLCQDCLNRIQYITDDYCEKCGKLITDEEECKNCEEYNYQFNKARAVAIYNQALSDYIYDLKYQGRQSLAKPLGQILGIYGLEFYQEEDVDIIIPVPLAEEKLKTRGFNQSYLLAREVSEKLDLPINDQVLKRAVNTVSQTKLSPLERKENVSNIFYCEPGQIEIIKGKHVLLIDDIYTTGATVNECSKVLLRAGVSEVSVLTLATGEQADYN